MPGGSALAHPIEPREITLEAPLPPDLAGFIAQLGHSDADDA